MEAEAALRSVALLLPVQIAVVLLSSLLCGWLLKREGQPRVVGEIAGGLLLGPLALGHLFPLVSAMLFAAPRLRALELISRVGLVLFLFRVGSELDFGEIRANRRSTVAITVGSVAVPFVLGVLMAPTLMARFAASGVAAAVHGARGSMPMTFVVFVGIAMSITALPVLASILEDREKAGRPMQPAVATQALLSAAANDLVAWCALALLLGAMHGDGGVRGTAGRLVLLLLYGGAMLGVVRPGLARLLERWPERLRWTASVLMVAVAFLSAEVTDALGIHAFFGAFLAGICVPRMGAGGKTLLRSLRRALELPIRVTLPLFFALTGLRMRREMFSVEGLRWLALVLLLATAGKIGGAALAARMAGAGWPAAGRIGILLNTRGLVELIALNIGYREGLLTPTLFTLFVLMALLTTAMTVPLLRAQEWLAERQMRPAA